MAEAVEANGWAFYSTDATRGRACGSCKSCCTVVPVEAPGLHKPAGTRCPHLRAKGCGIYEHRPPPCRYWSCRWLFDDHARDLIRPDISGYIVDPQLDTVLVDDRPMQAMQVWIDPERPHAHYAPELRAYMATVAERYRVPTIIRWGSLDGMLLIAPCLTIDGAWQERRAPPISRQEMQQKLVAAAATEASISDAYAADRS